MSQLLVMRGVHRPGQVPVPSLASDGGARIAKRLVLKPVGRQPERIAIGQQAIPVGTDEVDHRTTEPHMAVEPDPAIHGVYHPVSALLEFDRAERTIHRKQALLAACIIRIGDNGRQGRHAGILTTMPAA